MNKHLLPLLAALLLPACSDDAKKDGLEALQAGDYAGAAEALERALAESEAGSSEHLGLAVDRCRALAHLGDGRQAQEEFLQLSGTTPGDFSLVTSELVSAGHFLPAIEVLDAGMKRFPEEPKMAQLKDKVVAESQKAGDSEALEALKGLGYL